MNKELLEKARFEIMAAECSLWNVGSMPNTENIEEKLDDDLHICRAINALHEAERIIREIENDSSD